MVAFPENREKKGGKATMHNQTCKNPKGNGRADQDDGKGVAEAPHVERARDQPGEPSH